MWSSDASDCIVQNGEILIARSNTPELVGRVAMFNGEAPGAVASDLTIRICPDGEIHGDFLAQYLSALYLSGYWRERAGGASGTMKKITRGQILTELIPVPPLDEQRSVASELTRCLAVVQQAQVAVAGQIDGCNALSHSIVSQSVTSSSRSLVPIGHALDEVTQGVGVRWSKHRVLGATRSGLAPARERPGKQAERYKPVTAGTVFYNPMRILIGSIAFVDDDDEPGITSPDYVVLKGKPGVVDSRWFYYWLRSPLGERCIQSLARGAVRERMLFKRLAEGEIELPDYDTQVKASKALAQIKPMRAAILNQLAELELLPQKLLAQVFES
jgi:type I restriction enzyme S subunit